MRRVGGVGLHAGDGFIFEGCVALLFELQVILVLARRAEKELVLCGFREYVESLVIFHDLDDFSGRQRLEMGQLLRGGGDLYGKSGGDEEVFLCDRAGGIRGARDEEAGQN